MARKRTLKVAAVNIVAHPHPEGIYREILQHIYRIKEPIKIRGDQFLIISSISVARDGYVDGIISRFTNIDPEAEWFDTENLDKATEEQMESISIPENLRPNHKPFMFRLLEKHHCFVIESYGEDGSLSPNSVRKFFDKSFEKQDFVRKFGEVECQVLSSHSGLEAILSLPIIKKIEVTISKPNPDDTQTESQEIERRLERLRAKRSTEILEADSPEGLVLDTEVTTKARVALSDGDVKARGRDNDGNPVTLSLSDFPQEYSESYDPDGASARQVFSRISTKIVDFISRRD